MNNLPTSPLLKYKPTNLEPTPQPTSLLGFHAQLLAPALITPRPGPCRPAPSLRAHYNCSSWPVLSRVPCLTVPSCRNRQKGTCPQFSLLSASCPTVVLPGVAFAASRAPFLGSVSITNYPFSGNCLLICWPYFTSNFLLIHCILEQLL